MHELDKLKYILNPAGEINMNGNAVNAASKNKDPIAKKIDIHT